MSILQTTSIAEYFKEQLDTLCRTRKLELSEPAGFYVVKVLVDFGHTEKLFLPAEDARTRELVPLAELMARALDANSEDRVKLLRHMGDSSLYIGGFFQESLGRHNVDVSYYVGMGGRAYTELSGSRLTREQTALRPVFEELAAKMNRVVELLSEMAFLNQGLSQSAQAVLKLYEKWVETGNAAAGAKLRKVGVLPGGGVAQ